MVTGGADLYACWTMFQVWIFKNVCKFCGVCETTADCPAQEVCDLALRQCVKGCNPPCAANEVCNPQTLTCFCSIAGVACPAPDAGRVPPRDGGTP